jgi:hypothetical protein
VRGTRERGEAVLAGRADDVAPLCACLDAGDAVVGIDLDAAHLVRLDEQRVAEVAERRGVVAGALRGDPQALALGVQDGGDHLVGVAGHGDSGRPLVDRKVPCGAHLVVARVAGADDVERLKSHGIHARDRRFALQTFRQARE